MNYKRMCTALVAVGLIGFANIHTANAGLFGSCGLGGSCCGTSVWGGCAPACCTPDPCCDPCCGRGGLLKKLFGGLHRSSCCDDVCCDAEPACGCEPACGAEPACGCEPACGAEPACGCEVDTCCDPCGSSCRPKFRLIKKLFSKLHRCGSSCCDPCCDAEPACGCEPACGAEPACGCN